MDYPILVLYHKHEDIQVSSCLHSACAKPYHWETEEMTPLCQIPSLVYWMKSRTLPETRQSYICWTLTSMRYKIFMNDARKATIISLTLRINYWSSETTLHHMLNTQSVCNNVLKLAYNGRFPFTSNLHKFIISLFTSGINVCIILIKYLLTYQHNK